MLDSLVDSLITKTILTQMQPKCVLLNKHASAPAEKYPQAREN